VTSIEVKDEAVRISFAFLDVHRFLGVTLMPFRLVLVNILGQNFGMEPGEPAINVWPDPKTYSEEGAKWPIDKF